MAIKKMTKETSDPKKTRDNIEQTEHEKRLALGRVISEINIELNKIDSKGYFWCPKEIAGHGLGFTLYIYGGHAFDLYYGGNGANTVCIKKFDKKYSKFDSRKTNAAESSEDFVSPTWKMIGNANCCLHTVINLGDEWKYIFEMFKNWAEANSISEDDTDSHRKTNMERYRENIIACINKNNVGGIRIIEIESSIELMKPTIRRDGSKHSHAKPDMIGLRKDNDSYIISFIEYKCTNNAVSGDVSLPEHYEDMYAYYKDSKVIEGIAKRYNFANEVFGNPERIESSKCKTEIIFLFSHVSLTDEDPKKVKYTWIGSKIIQMMSLPGYRSRDLVFMSLKDISKDKLAKDKVILPDFDIEKFQKELNEQKNKKDYKQEYYKRIGKLFL